MVCTSLIPYISFDIIQFPAMDRKPIRWLGTSPDDLSRFPAEVKELIGFALHLAQTGQKHQQAKRMQYTLRAVFEIVEDFKTDTYRTMYTITTRAIYCLHAFKKKSRKGSSTPKRELDLITRRLREAEKHEEDEEDGESKS